MECCTRSFIACYFFFCIEDVSESLLNVDMTIDNSLAAWQLNKN